MSDEIYLLGKRLKLRLTAGGFRPGLDSVMLAAACPAKAGRSLLDLGCGVGSAGLCVQMRVDGVTLTGIDIDEESIECARENAALNGLESRTEFHHMPVSSLRKQGSGNSEVINQPDSSLRRNDSFLFDHVICNPPFLEDGTHTRSPDAQKARANGHEDDTTLEDWAKAAFNALKSGGSLTMIHRADHVDQIIRALGKSFGATEIIPLWPKAGIPAKRVIIRTIKHRQSPAKIHQGLVLHEENGDYTAQADKILRETEFLA